MATRPVRIGIDYRPALQNREGIGRYTRELVRALLELADAPHLALYGSTLAPIRVPDARPPAARLRRWRLPTRAQNWLLRAGRGADGFLGGCDVFHHTQYHRLPVRRAAEVVTLYDCIYASEAHFVAPRTGAAMEQRARSLAAHARRILVPSAYVRTQVARTFDVPEERIDVTPLGCDHVAAPGPRDEGAAPPGGIPARGTPYVLTLTRIEPRKNHLRMLRAFEGLVAAGLPQRWVLAGPAGHRAEDLRDALARSPARERVDWLGAIPERDLGRLLAGADVFLFTSLSEGFGLPPLEAMAAGVPVVTSRTTSLGEVCAGGALLVDPLDVDATREALCSLAGDARARARQAALGRERAAHFTWRRCAESTRRSYAAALAD